MLLLYRTSNEEDAIAKYVNESLSRGYLTVYLPAKTAPSPLSESIDYQENVNQGNLLTFDTKTFYNFALAGNLEPFEELKVVVEEAIKERSAFKRNEENGEGLIVVILAEVAAELSRNEKFEECIKVEKWWQRTHSDWLQKGLKVTVICPHPRPIFERGEFMHYKEALSSLHNEMAVEPGSVP